jgi:hypothetical protein
MDMDMDMDMDRGDGEGEGEREGDLDTKDEPDNDIEDDDNDDDKVDIMEEEDTGTIPAKLVVEADVAMGGAEACRIRNKDKSDISVVIPCALCCSNGGRGSVVETVPMPCGGGNDDDNDADNDADDAG